MKKTYSCSTTVTAAAAAAAAILSVHQVLLLIEAWPRLRVVAIVCSRAEQSRVQQSSAAEADSWIDSEQTTPYSRESSVFHLAHTTPHRTDRAAYFLPI